MKSEWRKITWDLCLTQKVIILQLVCVVYFEKDCTMAWLHSEYELFIEVRI